MKIGKLLKDGLFSRNPVLVQVLGMCSALAVTTSLINGIGMGLSVTAVLIASNITVSMLRNVIPHRIRITVCIVIIAGFVTAVDMLMKVFFPGLSISLGIFVPLIVANCLVLSRCEAFALKNTVFTSAIDGLAQGLGYTLAIVLTSVIREFLGSGTFGSGLLGIDGSGIRIIPDGYPASLFILPFGGFLTLGCLVAFAQWIANRKALKSGRKSEAEK